VASGEDAYRALHWGLSGDEEIVRVPAPDPRQGTLVKLGTLRAVEYETEKYGDGLSVYRHKFQRPFPTLAVQHFGGDRYGSLIIVGGGYAVEWRGIVR
jgi:hypothetical protein